MAKGLDAGHGSAGGILWNFGLRCCCKREAVLKPIGAIGCPLGQSQKTTHKFIEGDDRLRHKRSLQLLLQGIPLQLALLCRWGQFCKGAEARSTQQGLERNDQLLVAGGKIWHNTLQHGGPRKAAATALERIRQLASNAPVAMSQPRTHQLVANLKQLGTKAL